MARPPLLPEEIAAFRARLAEVGARLFAERGFEGVRSYYEWVDKGEFQLEYTVRLNQAGKFSLPPTRVEAMYRPEAFAELPNGDWEIAR